MSNFNNTTQSGAANPAPAPARNGINGSTSVAANLAPAAAVTVPATWNENTINLLINQRKHRNVEFHRLIGGKTEFWESVARRINRSAEITLRECSVRENFKIWCLRTM